MATLVAVAHSAIDLAARAVQLRRPDQGLAAVSALRRQLETLEAAHVANALRAGWSWRQIAEALGVSKQAAHRKHARSVGADLDRQTADEPQAGRVIVTAEARRAVQRARDEARGLRHEAVLPQHLLLGLLGDGYGPAARALAASRVTLEAARTGVRDAVGPGREAADARLPISPAARTVFEQALREAVRLRDAHLGVEHLLLTLLNDETSGVGAVLEGLGTSVQRVCDRLGTVLEQPTVIFRPERSAARQHVG